MMSNREQSRINPVPEYMTAYGTHLRVGLDCGPPESSLTRQEFKDECDINNVLKRFERTGVIDHLNNHTAQYGDFLGYPGYQESMNAVIAANEAFAGLPSVIRKRFNNDPAAFLEFVQDESNLDEAVKLGIAVKRPHEGSVADAAPEGAPAPEGGASAEPSAS